MDDVKRFLDRFHISDCNIETVFTSGACYWFAFILYNRFIRHGATVMYASVDDHFGTKVFGRVYDITGDVTDKYDWRPWLEFNDDAEKSRIIRDCIMF